jgi:hypothetical protein
MQVMIDAFFKEMDEIKRPYTVTGLALALGFTSRQAILNYEDKPNFVDTLKKAKLKIEHYNEYKLYDKGTPTAGVIFNLANNYNRQNKQTIDQTVREMDPLKEKLKKVMKMD